MKLKRMPVAKRRAQFKADVKEHNYCSYCGDSDVKKVVYMGADDYDSWYVCRRCASAIVKVLG